MSAEPAAVMNKLDALATRLDSVGTALAKVETELTPLEEEWEAHLDHCETAMYDEAQQDDSRLPSESMRRRLARRDWGLEKSGKHVRLLNERKALERRERTLKAEVDAQRSILSALKVEAEAGGAGLGLGRAA